MKNTMYIYIDMSTSKHALLIWNQANSCVLNVSSFVLGMLLFPITAGRSRDEYCTEGTTSSSMTAQCDY